MGRGKKTKKGEKFWEKWKLTFSFGNFSRLFNKNIFSERGKTFSNKSYEQLQTTFSKESSKRVFSDNLGSPRSRFQIID